MIKLRQVISYSQFTQREASTPNRSNTASIPAALKAALQDVGNITYGVSWGLNPVNAGIYGAIISYGPSYPSVNAPRYISDASYTALKNAGSAGLSGSANIPTDVKAMCSKFWPGVSSTQIVKAGYYDAYSINCTKTGGIAPHNLTLSIAAATLQNKSFAYDQYEFYNNLGEFCPTGWRPPFESDYTSLQWTGRQMLDLKQRLNRYGQYRYDF